MALFIKRGESLFRAKPFSLEKSTEKAQEY
jgi:hypothetical protein